MGRWHNVRQNKKFDSVEMEKPYKAKDLLTFNYLPQLCQSRNPLNKRFFSLFPII